MAGIGSALGDGGSAVRWVTAISGVQVLDLLTMARFMRVLVE